MTYLIRTILTTCLLAAAVALAGASRAGTIIYVWPGSTQPPTGQSWQAAYHTIQQAAGEAIAGDEIWVAAATYAELVTLKSGVALYGGFPAGGGDWESRDASVNRTTIDGAQSGSVVTIEANATSDTLIDGFTIQNGKGTAGGGISCGAGALPTITHNIIRFNTASNYGGGISGGGTVSHNVITGNSSPHGGAIWCSDSTMFVSFNTISDNRASWGGAMRFYRASGIIACNYIQRNVATSGICGIYLGLSSPTVSSNIISENRTTMSGGAIECSTSDSCVVNNTIVKNTASQGGGIVLRGTCSPVVANNIVAYNSSGIYMATSTCRPTLKCNDVYGNPAYNHLGLGAGSTDISTEPGFVDAGGGDYHITQGSCCRDAGDNGATVAGWPDIDGEPRVFWPLVDIGADENHSTSSLVDVKRGSAPYSFCVPDLVVSACWPGLFYAQTADRTCGIRVEKAHHGLSTGAVVSLTGTAALNSSFERYIAASGFVQTGSAELRPLGLCNRAIGGADWNYDPVRGTGQMGVTGSFGLNNIGLLVTTCGKVTARGRDWFYVDDGSRVRDGTPNVGICCEADGLVIPAIGACVAVTGASSCESFDGRLVNLLRVCSQESIRILQSP